jgi:hypothetical protein
MLVSSLQFYVVHIHQLGWPLCGLDGLGEDAPAGSGYLFVMGCGRVMPLRCRQGPRRPQRNFGSRAKISRLKGRQQLESSGE